MLEGTQVAQRTPSRVAHRRADKTRHRDVTRCSLVHHRDDGLQARILLEGDAGLYIKELISGDEGRSDPSLAGLLDVGARCTALDVVDVEGPAALDATIRAEE
jgi:tRNA pseudouridine synthase 10